MDEEKCLLTFTFALDGDLLISHLLGAVEAVTCSRVDDQLGALDAPVQVLGEGRGNHPVVVAVGDEGFPTMGSIYSLELPPIRPALSARVYVSRSNRGSSPVASVVAIYSSIRR